MRLVTALLVKDEADRYLRRVLARCAEFSDDILVLDDGSTDDTVTVAKAAGCIVKQRASPGAWGNETPARAELWERGVKLAKDGWLLINDADQLLHGDPRPLCASWEVNAWAFVLLDLWDATHFRVDGYWQGHRTPRPWLVCPSRLPTVAPQWNGRGMHVGHFPPNLPLACGIAPPDEYYWLHYSYVTPEHRKAKHAQYLRVADQLTPQERAHAESILDP
jgi:glycosyltransferase involved in cell wall biosynthesis